MADECAPDTRPRIVRTANDELKDCSDQSLHRPLQGAKPTFRLPLPSGLQEETRSYEVFEKDRSHYGVAIATLVEFPVMSVVSSNSSAPVFEVTLQTVSPEPQTTALV